MATVLIVEDDPVCGRLTCEYVRAGGYQALLAIDGETALVMLREHRVDDMPIIALSGTNVDQLDLAEDYGANASLPKPVEGPPLLDLLKRVIEDSQTDWTAAWIHPEYGSVDRRVEK